MSSQTRNQYRLDALRRWLRTPTGVIYVVLSVGGVVGFAFRRSAATPFVLALLTTVVPLKLAFLERARRAEMHRVHDLGHDVRDLEARVDELAQRV